MSQTQEDVVNAFFEHLTLANYDRAKDFMVILQVVPSAFTNI